MKAFQGMVSAIAVVAGLLLGGAAMAQAVTFTKDTKLRAEPKFDASVVSEIAANTPGEATGKKGPWLNIKVTNAAGWALTTDVNFGTVGVNKSGGGVNVSGLFGRQQASTGTSTIGIRGLDNLDKASITAALGENGAIDTQQLALLDKYAVDKNTAQSFAQRRPLAPVSVSYSK